MGFFTLCFLESSKILWNRSTSVHFLPPKTFEIATNFKFDTSKKEATINCYY